LIDTFSVTTEAEMKDQQALNLEILSATKFAMRLSHIFSQLSD